MGRRAAPRLAGLAILNVTRTRTNGSKKRTQAKGPRSGTAASSAFFPSPPRLSFVTDRLPGLDQTLRNRHHLSSILRLPETRHFQVQSEWR
jgi:hypothetical protein